MPTRVVRRRVAAVIASMLVATLPACSRGGSIDGASSDKSAIPYLTVDPAATSSTDRAIDTAQRRLRANTEDDGARLALAQAFLQKARENGDPTLYGRAEVLLAQAKEGRPKDPGILVAEGVLALARHRFEEALTLGRLALRAAPGNPGANGVIVDALNELGRYDEALKATQRMVDVKPNLASLARVSYARELRGDLDGAITAMTQAVSAGGGSGENVAFVQVQLGNLLLLTGDTAGAETAYTAAERSFPGFAPVKAGRARLLVARADPGDAADLLAEVVDVLPTAEFVIAHGDALAAAGRLPEAKESYALVGAIAKLFRANGVNVDLELALFDADHHPGKATIGRARKAVSDRPSIQGHDALGWALFTAGDAEAAWAEAKQALGTGSRDPLFHFHAAAIADARGQREVATRHLRVVLASNPRFSAALVTHVERLAAKLGLTVPPPKVAS